MLNEKLLDNTNAWVIFAVALSLMLLGNYFGNKLGLWHQKKSENIDSSANPEIMGAIFGVLGFTLAFLFGMSLTRLEHKKEMVLDESSAVLAAYQQAQFLPEPHKAKASSMLKEYAQLRYDLASGARKNRDIKKLQLGIIKSEKIQDALLHEGLTANKLSDASGFIDSVSNIVDLNMRRIQNSTGDRIPKALKILMYAMALLGLTAMGYGSGIKGGKSMIPNIILVIIFATIIGIILDMDHPANALFKVNQQPMLDVLRRMNSMNF
mgnify:CR=1 FL=1